MKKMKMQSLDMTKANIERLKELFPNCVTTARDEATKELKEVIDFTLLKQELSDDIVTGTEERYHINWPGKREALLTANSPINKTLRPCRQESVDFDTTQNLFIEGDNLDALKLLQETYLGKVKMIYIDPPYNTGKDFIYNDNFTENNGAYLENSEQVDEEGNRLVTNPETNGRFHSDWLSMIYPRLKLAKNLLSDDGLIFISIDDREVHNIRKLCDEIFNESNFVVCLHVHMSSVQGPKIRFAKDGNIVKNAENVLCYSKKSEKKNIASNVLYDSTEYDKHYNLYLIDNSDGTYSEERLSDVICREEEICDNLNNLNLLSVRVNREKFITNDNIKLAYEMSPLLRDFVHRNKEKIVTDHNIDYLKKLPKNLNLSQNRIIVFNIGDKEYLLTLNSNNKIRQRIKLSEKIKKTDSFNRNYRIATIRGNWWPEFYKDMGNVSKEGDVKFENGKKPVRLIKQIAYMIGDSNGIVLDFFAGSCTTAHAVMELNAEDGGNRRFIMVQLPEKCDEGSEAHNDSYQTIADIGKERIRRAGTKIKSANGLIAPNLDIGFRVLKTDASNMNDTFYAPEVISQTEGHLAIDNIKTARSDEDLLFQVLIDWGFDLSLPITVESILSKKVFTVKENDENILMACFVKDGSIDQNFVKEIAERKSPRVVFCDAGIKNDSMKVNVEQIFKSISPDTELRSI